MALVSTSRVSGVDGAWRQQVLDLVLRLLLDPGVDRLARLLPCRATKSTSFASAPIVVLGQFEEVGRERIVFLRPESVRRAELVAAFLAVAVDFLDETAESGVLAVVGQGEVQRLGHLLGGLAACAGVGHAEAVEMLYGEKNRLPSLSRSLAYSSTAN